MDYWFVIVLLQDCYVEMSLYAPERFSPKIIPYICYYLLLSATK